MSGRRTSWVANPVADLEPAAGSAGTRARPAPDPTRGGASSAGAGAGAGAGGGAGAAPRPTPGRASASRPAGEVPWERLLTGLAAEEPRLVEHGVKAGAPAALRLSVADVRKHGGFPHPSRKQLERLHAGAAAVWSAVVDRCRELHAQSKDKKPLMVPLVCVAHQWLRCVPLHVLGRQPRWQAAAGQLHGSILRFLAICVLDEVMTKQLMTGVVPDLAPAPASGGSGSSSRRVASDAGERKEGHRGGKDIVKLVVGILGDDPPSYAVSEGLLLLANLHAHAGRWYPGNYVCGGVPGVLDAYDAAVRQPPRGHRPLYSAIALSMMSYPSNERAWEFGMRHLGNLCLFFGPRIPLALTHQSMTDGGLSVDAAMAACRGTTDPDMTQAFCHLLKSMGQAVKKTEAAGDAVLRDQVCRSDVLEVAVDGMLKAGGASPSRAAMQTPLATSSMAAIYFVVQLAEVRTRKGGDRGLYISPALFQKLEQVQALLPLMSTEAGVADYINKFISDWRATSQAVRQQRQLAAEHRAAAGMGAGTELPGRHPWEGWVWDAAGAEDGALETNTHEKVMVDWTWELSKLTLSLALGAYDVISDILQISNIRRAGHGDLAWAGLCVLLVQVVWTAGFMYACYRPWARVAPQQHLPFLLMPLFRVTAWLNVPIIGILYAIGVITCPSLGGDSRSDPRLADAQVEIKYGTRPLGMTNTLLRQRVLEKFNWLPWASVYGTSTIVFKVLTLLLEDLPQMTITVLFLFRQDALDAISIGTLAGSLATGLALLLSAIVNAVRRCRSNQERYDEIPLTAALRAILKTRTMATYYYAHLPPQYLKSVTSDGGGGVIGRMPLPAHQLIDLHHKTMLRDDVGMFVAMYAGQHNKFLTCADPWLRKIQRPLPAKGTRPSSVAKNDVEAGEGTEESKQEAAAAPPPPPQDSAGRLREKLKGLFNTVRGVQSGVAALLATVVWIWLLSISGVAMFEDENIFGIEDSASRCVVATAYIGLFFALLTTAASPFSYLVSRYPSEAKPFGAVDLDEDETEGDEEVAERKAIDEAFDELVEHPWREHFYGLLNAVVAVALHIGVVGPLVFFITYYVGYGTSFVFFLLFICRVVCDSETALDTAGYGVSVFEAYYTEENFGGGMSLPSFAERPYLFVSRLCVIQAMVFAALVVVGHLVTLLGTLWVTARHRRDDPPIAVSTPATEAAAV